MTTVLNLWHAPQIAKLNGRPMAHGFMVKRGIGMKCLVNLAHIVKHDSMGHYLKFTPAHEFVDIAGVATLWDVISLAKDECGPLAVVFDVHNNDPDNYHGNGTWEGDHYVEGQLLRSPTVWKQAVNEFDALFEPEFGQIGNEWADTEGYYARLVKQVAPMMQRRGMHVIAQAPGSYHRSIIKGTHLAINGGWSLKRTEAAVREYLAWNRSLDEVWGVRLHSNATKGAKQLMLPVRISFELEKDVVGVFVGDEGFPAKGPVWSGRALPTYAFLGGRATVYGSMLGEFLDRKNNEEPPVDPPFVPNAEAALRKIDRKVAEGAVGWVRGRWTFFGSEGLPTWVADTPIRPTKTVANLRDDLREPEE